MKYIQALELLHSFFEVDMDVFARHLSKERVLGWAHDLVLAGVKREGKSWNPGKYQLERWQHNFLIGM